MTTWKAQVSQAQVRQGAVSCRTCMRFRSSRKWRRTRSSGSRTQTGTIRTRDAAARKGPTPSRRCGRCTRRRSPRGQAGTADPQAQAMSRPCAPALLREGRHRLGADQLPLGRMDGADRYRAVHGAERVFHEIPALVDFQDNTVSLPFVIRGSDRLHHLLGAAPHAAIVKDVSMLLAVRAGSFPCDDDSALIVFFPGFHRGVDTDDDPRQLRAAVQILDAVLVQVFPAEQGTLEIIQQLPVKFLPAQPGTLILPGQVRFHALVQEIVLEHRARGDMNASVFPGSQVPDKLRRLRRGGDQDFRVCHPDRGTRGLVPEPRIPARCGLVIPQAEQVRAPDPVRGIRGIALDLRAVPQRYPHLVDVVIDDLPREGVAVGTALAGGPPRRSQRAGLPHWAPTMGGWRRSAARGTDA